MRQKVTTKSIHNFGEIKSTTPIKSHSRQGSYSKSKSIDHVFKIKGAKQEREVMSQERQNEGDKDKKQINIDINNQKKELIIYSKVNEKEKKDMIQFQKNLSEPDFLISESFKRKQNFIDEGSQSNRIQLIVRVRPFLISEELKECLKVINDNGIRLFKEYHQIHFKFDNILLPKDNQDCVFNKIQSKHNTMSLLIEIDTVNSFMKGVNGTIFAYGQTGAGKTYSIIGGSFQDNNAEKDNMLSLFQHEKKGILPRTLDYVYSQLSHFLEQNNKAKLYISFYEIYNEKIFDLLSIPSQNQNTAQNIGNKKQFTMMKKESIVASASRDHLDLREEKDGYFSIVDLRKVECSNLQEAYSWLEKGIIKRQTSSTSLNSNSSRSHSIFQIYFERLNEEGIIVKSKLRIVDLAGSEKYTLKRDLPAAEKSIKVQELTSINSSLSALGQCISALADQTRKHIPYRNSKLTRVLKDSLDENSNVAMIICISPSVDSYKETFSTLQFADRAKKAILDGRNFSDSKLLGGGEQVLQQYKLLMNYNGLSEGGSVQYFQKEVLDELDRLKKKNKELQEKVDILEHKKSKNLVLKGCLKQHSQNNIMNIIVPRANAMNIQDDQSDNDESPLTKRVHFATKLQNDDSLDSETRERIEHNLKYNDDTIFDNISIFRDLNNSGIVLLPKKLKDNKDVHPSVLKRRLLMKEGRKDVKDLSNEEEEEERKDNQQEIDDMKEQSEIKEEGALEHTSPRSLNEHKQDKKLDQFWGIQSNDNYYQEGKMGVSPIQRKHKNVNISSQDVSKDLIDLENENQFGRIYNVGDKTMGTKKKNKQNDQASSKVNQRMTAQVIRKQNEDELQQSIGLDDEDMKERDITIEEDDNDDDMAKDYHVCDSSEQFFGHQQDPEQILSDSIVMDMMIVEEAGNGSQDNQNTLMLDSQSMIIEAGEGNPLPVMQRDPNLSQQMQSFEASIINQQQNYLKEQTNPYGQYFTQNVILNMPIHNGFQSSSNGTSSIVNTDILTYSLTNTYTTIESLHDELVVIKNGLEQSQKRGANILKTIQKYAKEIEENKISDEEFEENVHSNEDSFKEDQSQLEDENLNFIKDIKGFHDKIHNEIGQLKNILMDQTKSAHSPISTRKHILSERVPQKSQPSLLQTPNQFSSFSPDAIDHTQNLINEIKKEMNEILGLNQEVIRSHSSINQAQYESNVSKAQKSVKIIDLLETLQQSLLYSVKPILCMKRNQNTPLISQNNQSLSSSQNFMFSPQKFNKNLKVQRPQAEPQRKSSDQFQQQRQDHNKQTLKFSEQQKVHKSSIKSNSKMSQYLLSGVTQKQKPNETNSKQIQYKADSQDLQNIPIFNKSPPKQQVELPQFNQIPPILQMSPPQVHSMLTEDEDNNMFDPLQKTPEIFKSLSKFHDNSNHHHNYSSRRSDYHNSMNLQFKDQQQIKSNNPQSQEQQSYINVEYGTDSNQQQFYSKQNETYNIILNRINTSDLSSSNVNTNQQDFQITLRQSSNIYQSDKQDPYNNGPTGNSINNISQIMETNQPNNNNNNINNGTYRKKGGDNTLTLIFDSDEEEQENDAEQNQSVGKVKEIEEFFFNEDNSKIERGSSVN